MLRVFISYRRQTWPFAQRLAEALRSQLHADVFVDTSGIDEADFEQSILGNLRACDVFVLIVTPETFDPQKISRPDDWVRREIAKALSLNKPIVLAMVDGFTPPPANQLPQGIHKIARKQGIEFYPRFFDAGVKELASLIRLIVPHKPIPRWPLTITAALIIILAVVGWAIVSAGKDNGKPLTSSTTQAAQIAKTQLVGSSLDATSAPTDTPQPTATAMPTATVTGTPPGGGAGRIAFTSNRDGNYEIYVMNADGSDQTNLTRHPANDRNPSWSPDGSRIAFVSLRDGNDEIYVMNADGSGQTRLTNNPAADFVPAWSPDGSRIAFVSLRDGNYEIYVMNTDGSGLTNLTNNPKSDNVPLWSPDGARIVFSSNRDGAYAIYVMDADGSSVTRLTRNPSDDDYPSWSPDGSHIAFVSYRDGNSEIYVMNTDGSGQTRLTMYKTADDSTPVWSPDGWRIAFMSNRTGHDEIYLMNIDGSDQTRLTRTPADSWSPAWSP